MSRLTKRIVDAAPVKSAPYFLWCSELRGFGVRIWPTGRQVFYADYYNAGGARKRMMIGQYGKVTCEEARKLAIGILGSVVKGDDPAEERQTSRKSITVRELCDRYFAAAERGLIMGKRRLPKKAATIYTDRGRIVRHIVPLLGNKRVRDLVQADINKFIRDVASGKTAVIEKTANKRGKAVVEGGSGTAARTAGLLGGILSFAVSEGIRADNPARGVQRAAGERRRRRLNADEYRALGKALAAADARHEPWQIIAIVRLLALSGARLSEIVNLKWSEVDQESHCLRLSDSKEGASTRPLGDPALKLLAALGKTDDFVFPAVRRGQGAFGGMAGGWRRLMQGADLAGVTPHTLRHSFASVADDLGLTMATTGALLGHSAGSVTHRYVHKLDAALIAAADSVAAAIHKDMSEGGAHVTQGIRLLEAYMAERPLPAADARDGRPPEPDERLLWDMALRRAEEPGLSRREAAKLTVDDYVELHGKIHSPKAAVDRLRKKYAEHAELFESVTNEANWVKTRRAS